MVLFSLNEIPVSLHIIHLTPLCYCEVQRTVKSDMKHKHFNVTDFHAPVISVDQSAVIEALTDIDLPIRDFLK